MPILLVEGWTERIRDALEADGASQSLVGASVELKLYTRHGVPVQFTGTAGIENAGNGIVYFDPAAGDLVAAQSPYLVRWKVTDSGGKTAYFPNGPAAQWVVRKP